MQHNEDGSVTFEEGDYVGDNTTGEERFGEVVRVEGEVLVVSDGKSETWEVLENSVYPG
ncbi:MAG: hypothetical protein Q8P85_10365 [Pseudomonas sp.]|nr:hypothetical protein [Pseudomonas sp.]